ncbi:MAG: hypothetical protein P8Y47_08065 [Alphaproteobacteria bacterium]
MSNKRTMFLHAGQGGNFSSISNELLQATDISLEAKGLLVSFLSLPRHWQFNANWAQKHFKIGEAKLSRIMRECKEAGFVRVERERDAETGRYTGLTTYTFTDVPYAFSVHRKAEKPVTSETEDVDDSTTSITSVFHAVDNSSAGEIEVHIKEPSSLRKNLHSRKGDPDSSEVAAVVAHAAKKAKPHTAKKRWKATQTDLEEFIRLADGA